MTTDLPQRKPNRLADYDYGRNGAYFVTICARDKHEFFGRIVGANSVHPYPTLEPSDIGGVVIREIEKLSDIYQTVLLDRYVVMPNHLHIILLITDIGGFGQTPSAPTLSRVIKQWKGVVTKQIGFSPWQKSFHDHIIWSKEDYARIAKYIQNNPATWERDCFYPGKR
jgi:REP element-mobilizing transposase RayT